jgi:hypothetical protein
MSTLCGLVLECCVYILSLPASWELSIGLPSKSLFCFTSPGFQVIIVFTHPSPLTEAASKAIHTGRNGIHSLHDAVTLALSKIRAKLLLELILHTTGTNHTGITQCFASPSHSRTHTAHDAVNHSHSVKVGALRLTGCHRSTTALITRLTSSPLAATSKPTSAS